MRKKYLYLLIIVLALAFLGFISLPKINLGQCNGHDHRKRFYLKLPFVNIPIDLNVCD